MSDASTQTAEAESVRAYLLFVAERLLDDELRAKAGASDLVQDALVAAHQGRGEFRGTTAEEYRAWVRSILVNLIHNFRRAYRGTLARQVSREEPIAPGLLDAAADTPSGLAVRGEDRQRLGRAVAELPEHYRLAVTLRFGEGLPFAEVGARLGGRSPDAARMLVKQAVVQLREALERIGG